MAEAFLLPLANNLIEKIASASFREIRQIWGVEDDLKRLEATLSSIKSVLLDAAQQQVYSASVRNWVEQLQDVLRDTEDLFDEFMTEEMRRKMEIGDSKRKEFSNLFNKTSFSVKMSRKVKKLRQRLDQINEDRRNYQFVERVFTDHSVHRSKVETHAFVQVSDVLGRDQEKEEVLRLLLDPKSHDSNPCVLPIVGLGGLGKTTLTKLVYNDPKIDDNFDKKIWVCVSEDFDIRKLVKKILEADSHEKFPELDLDPLRTCLQNRLKSQKFMLVLDDVWNEDPMKWTDLEELLKCGAPGSTILVTTRIMKIAVMVGSLKPYCLSSLQSEVCMSIFLKYAFKEGQEKTHPRLVEIGKQIVSKCGGLPLAVRTLGSLLCTTTDEGEWNSVKDNGIWETPQEETGVLPILRLSYDRMSLHLKQCFAYCSTYPKDSLMSSQGLIYRWIAHGFVQSSDERRPVEEIGHQYIKELLSMSLLQDVTYTFSGDVWTFKLHDLVHDLALSVAGKEVVHCDSKKVIHENACHLLFCKGYGSLDGKAFPESLLKLKKVRSFGFECVVGPVRESWIDTLIKSFNHLRFMNISGAKFETLPDSIGTLQHLRYLLLCLNPTITVLPDSLCKLLNLVALDLYGCDKLRKLPSNFHHLQRLRMLILTSAITFLAEKDLQGLSSLQRFVIYNCHSLESFSDEGLQHLSSLWKIKIGDCPRLTSIPQSIQFLSSLKKLSIRGCQELNLLEGKGFQGLPCLEELALTGLPKLVELPLSIAKFTPTLKYFRIKDCPSLESLEGLQNCTSLLKLSISTASLYHLCRQIYIDLRP